VKLRWLDEQPLVALLAAVLLFAPLFFRVAAGDPLVPGSHVAGLYQFLVAPLGDGALLASVLLGVLSALLFARLVRRLKAEERRLAVLLFLFNPMTLGIFTTLGPYTVAIPLALAALLFRGTWPSSVLLVLTALFSPVLGLLLFGGLLLSERRVLTIGAAVVAAALILLFHLPVEPIVLARSALVIAEFGAVSGLSLLYVVLALLEALLLWREPKSRVFSGLLAVALLASPFSVSARVTAAFLATVLAARFMSRLLRRKWQLPEARAVTVILVGCSFLFLLIAQTVAIVDAQPTHELVATLHSLPADDGVILAPPALGYTIERLTDHPALLHDCSQERGLCDDAASLYRSWRLKDAEAVLNRYGIRYLLITQAERDGLVWTQDEEGLLFLLAHSDRFHLLAQDPQEQLWVYAP